MFITQPTLYDKELDDNHKKLIWAGGIGDFQNGKGNAYYSVKALAEAMQQFNDVLLKICKTENVPWLDAHRLLPKDTTVFYDDCHFNESGSQKLAELLYQKIVMSGLF